MAGQSLESGTKYAKMLTGVVMTHEVIKCFLLLFIYFSVLSKYSATNIFPL